MLKITLLFTALHILLLLCLLVPISRHRYRLRIGIGDGGDASLQRKIRVHANFIEYAPLALLMLGLLEISGLGATWLWLFGTVLLLGRVMHAVGFSLKAGYSFGRFYGTALTWLVLLAMALAGLWLMVTHGT